MIQTTLIYLNLNNNQLKKLPSSIGNLAELRTLIVGRNQMEQLPPEIGKLTHLIELNVAGSGAMLQFPNTLCEIRSIEILIVDASMQVPGCVGARNYPRFKIIIQ